MKKKLTITLVFWLLLIGIAAGYFKYNSVSGDWRYRMTVEIETPEGVKTGSAVREVSNSDMRHRILDLPDATNRADFRGEAVVVDLGERGKVFAILGVDPEDEFYHAFNIYNGASTFEGIKRINKIPLGTTAVVDPAKYPWFVTFKDMSDPKSVTLVRGGKFNTEKQDYDLVDNFEARFGEGVRLKSVIIERTDEPVTRKIDNTFPNYQPILLMAHSIRFDLQGE